MKKCFILLVVIVCLPAHGGIIPVTSWPSCITTAGGVTHNPSVAQCVTEGYRLVGEAPPAPSGKVLVSRAYAQDPDNQERAVYVDEYADIPAPVIPGKSLELKRAENAFLAAVSSVNAAYSLDITPADGFQDVLAKIKSSESPSLERIDRLEIGVELRTLWDVVLYHGGSWTNLEYHPELYEEE